MVSYCGVSDTAVLRETLMLLVLSCIGSDLPQYLVTLLFMHWEIFSILLRGSEHLIPESLADTDHRAAIRPPPSLPAQRLPTRFPG